MRLARVTVGGCGGRVLVLGKCWVAGVVRPRPLDWSIYLNIAIPAALMNQHFDEQAVQSSESMYKLITAMTRYFRPQVSRRFPAVPCSSQRRLSGGCIEFASEQTTGNK
jgi:hypothetical protein